VKIAKLPAAGRGESRRFSFPIPIQLAAAIGVLSFFVTAYADPIADLRSWSVFKDADLNKLASGDVLATRGPAMSFARGLSVQNAYVVRAPVRTTLSMQEQWNPVRHPELKIYAQSGFSGRGSPSDFQGLASAPSNGAVREFVDATLKLPQSASKLQLSNADARSFSGGGSSGGTIPASVVAFWSKVLADRAQSFASGGLSGLPPYDTNGTTVRADQEVQELVRSSGNVRSYFAPLIESTPIGGRGGRPESQSWQLFDADGMAAVSLTASYSRPAGSGYQEGDLQYYSSGAVYVVLTFYQLWPVTVGNQEATLVWRVDMVSASELGELRGVERLGSGAAMMREIQKSVKAFLRDYPGGR
jgi:hypothetical protein